MRRTAGTALLTAMALTLALPMPHAVIAASGGAPQPSASTPPAAPPRDDPKSPPGQTAGTPAVVMDDNEVESLLGKDIKSASGEKLGQITDVIAGKSGEIRAAVIDFGGFLGVGNRKIAIAWSALRFTPDAVIVDMTRDELRVTPEYRPGEPIVVVGSAPRPPKPNAPLHPEPSPPPPSGK